MWFWCLQASSDEERRYSCFAGERRVTYHGLQEASVEHSCSRLRGRWEERRDEEDRGRRRARGREEWSRSGRVGGERSEEDQSAGRADTRGLRGDFGRREVVVRGHTGSPRGERALQGGGHQCDGRGVRRCNRCSLEWLLAGVREKLREEAVGRDLVPEPGHRVEPGETLGEQGGGRLSWGEWHVGEGHLAGESHSHTDLFILHWINV